MNEIHILSINLHGEALLLKHDQAVDEMSVGWWIRIFSHYCRAIVKRQQGQCDMCHTINADKEERQLWAGYKQIVNTAGLNNGC